MWCPSVTVCGADCNGAAAAAGGARLTDGWPARLSRFWYLRYGFSPLLNRDRLATLVTLLGSLPSPSFCAHTPPPHQHATVRGGEILPLPFLRYRFCELKYRGADIGLGYRSTYKRTLFV
jgi:hypothetical protein